MEQRLRVGIDIGATKTNIGLINTQGSPLHSVTLSSQQDGGAQGLTAKICDALHSLLATAGVMLDEIAFIGVGIAGSADTARGMASYCPNLGWEDEALGNYFLRELGRNVSVSQDSWAAAWAEHLFGAGRGHADMLCVTLGTGIGCGVVINERIFAGAMSTAGEIGHTVIEPDGRLCSCGQRGCLERYVSGTAVLALALERFPHKLLGRPHKAQTVFELAYDGDSDALELIAYCADRLAFGLAKLVNVLSCNLIVFSGGMCEHDLLLQPLLPLLYQYGYPAWTRRRQMTIARAQLGAAAPMIGAAFLDKGVLK